MKIYNYEQGESEQGEQFLTKSFYYILTIKRNSNEFTPLLWINRQRDRVKRMAHDCEWSCHEAYELDSKDRLHLHTIISSDKELYFTKFKSKGWTVNFKQFPVEDYGRVVDYLTKAEKAYDGDLKQLEAASFIYTSFNLNKNLFE